MSAMIHRTPEKRDIFLNTLSDTGNVTTAAAKAGIPRRILYFWRDTDAEFTAEWDAAAAIGTKALEDEATRRASAGYVEPVFYKGVQVAEVTKYSDTLLMFMLKARDPAKFRDNYVAPATADGENSIVIKGGLPQE